MNEINALEFHDFEHRGWEEVAGRYQDSWSPVTTQSIEPLLNAVRAGKSIRLLDVACGPGYAAGAAAMRGAQVTGVDFSSQMVEEARRRYPSIQFEEGDAEHLSFAERSFDAVVINFGMLHLARPELALAEAFRVLDAGGRLAFTVWDVADQAVGFGIVLQAIQKHGNPNVRIPTGPPFFRFSDSKESEKVMLEAGFSGINVERVPQTWRLPSAGFLFTVMYSGSVRNAALLRAQTPEALEAIRQEMRASVEGYNLELPMPAVLISGIKSR
jgi:SAM-dependent methyltransferase